jgi:hypothetical protein
MDVEYGGRDNKLTPINSINIVFFFNFDCRSFKLRYNTF